MRLDPPGVPLTMHLKPKFWFRLRWNHGAKYPILHNGLMAQLRSRVVTALLQQLIHPRLGQQRNMALPAWGSSKNFCAFISGSSAQRLTCTVSGTTVRDVDMKIPVLIVFALVLLGTGGTLAFMNNACKSSQHSWCASDLRHHAKAGRS